MSEELQATPTQNAAFQELAWIDNLTDLLDARFRIPFTNTRFGIDFLIGLVPYAGDVISFGLSGGLLIAMARHGVSSWILLRMLWNVFLDATIGSIPILGDLFDLKYRANMRNLDLLKAHYKKGGEKGNVWGAVLLVVGVLAVMFFLLIYIVWKGIAWGIGLLGF